MIIIEILDLSGLALLMYRLWPRVMPEVRAPERWPSVSIIIPARNEEHTLPDLLASLKTLNYPNYEVIVLDDRSTDQTQAVAGKFSVRVLSGEGRPEGWFGKPWACHQASLKAHGEFLLFTDADTVHEPDSLRRAISELIHHKAQGMSSPPFHINPKPWERLLGPFQCFLVALTNPFGRPKRAKIFAIGQYLLFEKLFYFKMGGHQAIRGEAIDDLSLAELTLAHGGKWYVSNGQPLFRVRMYETLKEFVAGWRRNFRGGLKLNSKLSGLEVTLYMMALTAVRDPSWITAAITASAFVFLVWIQKRYGNFSPLGVLLLPFSLALFSLVTILAIFDAIFHKPLIWKNRSYSKSHVPNFPA